MRLECQSCGGQYDDVGGDGVRYFHVCPPLTYVAVTRAGKPGLVQLANVEPTDRLTVQRDGASVDLAAAETKPGDTRIGDVHLARSNARNENPIIVKVDGKSTATITSEGNGVLEVVAIDVVAAPAILDGTQDAIVAPRA